MRIISILDEEYNAGLEAAARDCEAEEYAIHVMGLDGSEAECWRRIARRLNQQAIRIREMKISIPNKRRN